MSGDDLVCQEEGDCISQRTRQVHHLTRGTGCAIYEAAGPLLQPDMVEEQTAMDRDEPTVEFFPWR